MRQHLAVGLLERHSQDACPLCLLDQLDFLVTGGALRLWDQPAEQDQDGWV